jgi:hypothetical protein
MLGCRLQQRKFPGATQRDNKHRLTSPSDQERAEKTAEIADGIDCRDTCRGLGAGEEIRRQESQDVEASGTVDRRKTGGDNAPGIHHPGDPAAGSNAVKSSDCWEPRTGNTR